MVKFTNKAFMKFDTCCMYCCSGEITKAQPRRMTKSIWKKYIDQNNSKEHIFIDYFIYQCI